MIAAERESGRIIMVWTWISFRGKKRERGGIKAIKEALRM